MPFLGTHEAKCRCCSVFVLPTGLPGCNVCFLVFLPIFFKSWLLFQPRPPTELHCRALWCHEWNLHRAVISLGRAHKWNLTTALFSQKGIRAISYVVESCFSPLFFFFNLKFIGSLIDVSLFKPKSSGLSMSQSALRSWLSHLADGEHLEHFPGSYTHF